MDSLAAPVVARFEIGHTRFVDQEGRVCAPLPAFAEDAAQLRSMYATMLLARALDKKAVALQRTGQLGTYASSLGQEAIGTAMGLALAADDVLIPAYREYPAQFLRGVPLHSIMAYWGGDERAMAYPAGVPAQHDFPLSVPIGTHVPQAIGVAYAFRLRKQARVVMTSCGDGAVWNLPIVFVVSNNQWAISLPRERQTGAETLAQKGIAGGLPSEQVDGNDVIATRFVLERAIERARSGGGPSLVEAITYRLHDHTTADDARRYRSEDEVKQAWERCPIKRLKRLLETAHGWSAADEAALQADCGAQAEAAAQTFLAMPPQAATAIIDHLYAELPRALRWQREELRQAGELA